MSSASYKPGPDDNTFSDEMAGTSTIPLSLQTFILNTDTRLRQNSLSQVRILGYRGEAANKMVNKGSTFAAAEIRAQYATNAAFRSLVDGSRGEVVSRGTTTPAFTEGEATNGVKMTFETTDTAQPGWNVPRVSRVIHGEVLTALTGYPTVTAGIASSGGAGRGGRGASSARGSRGRGPRRG